VNKPVYNIFGAEYTYKEIKDNELSLGLDLQVDARGTRNFTIDIVKGLSGNNRIQHCGCFAKAKAMEKKSTTLRHLFYQHLRKLI